MGVALSVCTLPGQVTSDRLGPGLMELGLGIVSSLLHIRNQFPSWLSWCIPSLFALLLLYKLITLIECGCWVFDLTNAIFQMKRKCLLNLQLLYLLILTSQKPKTASPSSMGSLVLLLLNSSQLRLWYLMFSSRYYQWYATFD